MSGSQPLASLETDDPHIFTKTIRSLSTFCGIFAALAIVVAVVITCQMIFVRFVLNGSAIWQTEAVIYLVISATIVGLPYVQRHKGHVNVDFLPLIVPPRFRKILALIVLLLSTVTIGIMLFYSLEHWRIAFERGWRSDTVWGVRLWIPYLSLPVGFGCFLLQLIADMVDLVRNDEQPFGLKEIE